jgi:membrane associated rhomboid family serine protease
MKERFYDFISSRRFIEWVSGSKSIRREMFVKQAIDAKSKPPLKLWRIFLIMVACGLVLGLLMGALQTLFQIHIPGAALGAGIGAIGGLLLGVRFARTRSSKDH